MAFRHQFVDMTTVRVTVDSVEVSLYEYMKINIFQKWNVVFYWTCATFKLHIFIDKRPTNKRLTFDNINVFRLNF